MAHALMGVTTRQHPRGMWQAHAACPCPASHARAATPPPPPALPRTHLQAHVVQSRLQLGYMALALLCAVSTSTSSMPHPDSTAQRVSAARDRSGPAQDGSGLLVKS